MRFLVRPREYRHRHVWVRVRVACGVFNVVLGVLLLASFHELGPLTWLAALPLVSLASVMGPGCCHEEGTTLGHE
jgi:hypothetical protein